MRLFHVGKDGGPYSTVTGYWLVELKRLFSIALLKFENGSREQFHSHAFNSISWVLSGELEERLRDAHGWASSIPYVASWLPVITRRATFHRVISKGTTWVITFRGPWARQWTEYDPETDKYSILEHGRNVVGEFDKVAWR